MLTAKYYGEGEGKRERKKREGGRKKEKEEREERKRERKTSLMRADLSSIVFRNPVLTASYVHLQDSVIEQCDGSKLLLNAKNLC